jgi:transcriptional regulatory protein RtcR
MHEWSERPRTLAEAGRITDSIVQDEMTRLKRLWHHYTDQAVDHEDVDLETVMGREAEEQLDLFDAMQLKAAHCD